MTKIVTQKFGDGYLMVDRGEDWSLIPLPLRDSLVMKPEYVDALLNGWETFSRPEVREAAKRYCLELMDLIDIEAGDLIQGALDFGAGYLACLKKHS